MYITISRNYTIKHIKLSKLREILQVLVLSLVLKRNQVVLDKETKDLLIYGKEVKLTVLNLLIILSP
jgi:hypothetical protein